MVASSASGRWCSSPPTPATPGCWSRQTNSPPDSPSAEIRCRCDIEETDTSYAIGWQGRYRIDGDTFVYEDNRSRRLIAIRGYPVKQLLRVISDS